MKKSKNITQILFISLIFAFLISNLFSLGQTIIKMRLRRSIRPYSFAGYQFLGLEKVFKKIPYAGYYTNKDLEKAKNNMLYSQAQFILAPTILDVNNAEHPYIIFDFTNPALALEKIKELGLIPLIKNKHGLILATQAR